MGLYQKVKSELNLNKNESQKLIFDDDRELVMIKIQCVLGNNCIVFELHEGMYAIDFASLASLNLVEGAVMTAEDAIGDIQTILGCISNGDLSVDQYGLCGYKAYRVRGLDTVRFADTQNLRGFLATRIGVRRRTAAVKLA